MLYLLFVLTVSFNSWATISESEFHQILDKVEIIYKPKYDILNKSFTIKRSWDNSKINAKAKVKDDLWWIDMFGGYPRHEKATKDGFTAFACHEIGHHLGGFPFWDEPNARWASAEGQADYFVSTKCLRILWDKEDNKKIVLKKTIPNIVKEKCKKVYLTKKQYWLCIRSALAGHEMMAPIAYKYENLNIATPNSWETSFTFVRQHPGDQCRLDTLFQGALCSIDPLIEFDSTDETVGACSRVNGFSIGTRPRCWFLPALN